MFKRLRSSKPITTATPHAVSARSKYTTLCDRATAYKKAPARASKPPKTLMPLAGVNTTPALPEVAAADSEATAVAVERTSEPVAVEEAVVEAPLEVFFA